MLVASGSRLALGAISSGIRAGAAQADGGVHGLGSLVGEGDTEGCKERQDQGHKTEQGI